MKLRKLTDLERHILDKVGAKRLSTIHKCAFNSPNDFMNAWVKLRAPQWNDIKAGDYILLSTKSPNKSKYYVHSIDLEHDIIRLTLNHQVIMKERHISDMPYMELLVASKVKEVKKHKQLF